MTNPAKIQSHLPATLLFFVIVLFQYTSFGQTTYQLNARSIDKDSVFLKSEVGLQTEFPSRNNCIDYVNKLPSLLQAKGFVTSSLDSVYFDSTFANIVIYLGQQYKWAHINITAADPQLLAISGWNEKAFTNKPINFDQVKNVQDRMLVYLENNGYPFAKIFLDSIHLIEDSVSANLVVDKGPLYKIDSIRVYGNARISNDFLQRYLEIPNGSIYSREKLMGISKKIHELSFVEEEQPSNMSLLGTGSVLNLYLKQRRSSQVNALIGFLPNNDQLSSKKLLITGEANIHLRNAFGGGEALGLNWQQLQVKSPRLNIFYRHPYLFRSPMGVDFAFDMLRKDSTYLNINLNFGGSYVLSESESGRIFFQHFQTILSQGGVNNAQVIATRTLPDIADLKTDAIGVEFEKIKTNYRLNPRSGYEFRLGGSAGIKKIKKNNAILELKDPSDPSFDFDNLYDTVKLKSYQLKFVSSVAKYFPVGKQGTFKTAINGGALLSDNIFRNELFQIGGYKLLRGFDEESQYVSQYAVGTLEYRYLIGLNSFFFGFVDGGWARNNSRSSKNTYGYVGTGLGLALETKSSLFTIAWAVGKRDDAPFNLRQSKIHFGFMNYF
ncbi:MAG TPA: ShlB/FhaC/HecB family hemolysin secretion/activation protein [Chitinophagaceae bacterium]|nr:ShlB/FhaC/HecB family hemolysin secretion/activation protein [Chitinophagaceae bacterium]